MRHFTMKILTFLSLLGAALHGAAAVTHSLKYLFTSSSQVSNIPEFVAVGLVDGVHAIHYDSNTKKAEPKLDWMSRFTADHPEYLKRDNEHFKIGQDDFKATIVHLKYFFGQTGGVHVFQMIYRCEWDDKTGEVDHVWQFGYDAEKILELDLQTRKFITIKPQADFIRSKLDNNNKYIDGFKEYLILECHIWLKKLVEYRTSSLQRTVLPSVSLLQKTPSSPVSCHATGFYPNRAVLLWRKDGGEILNRSEEIFPNQDETFQMRVNLSLSSVRPEDWKKYHCVLHLNGVKDNIITRLDKDKIRSNEEKPFDWTVIIITAAIAQALCFIAGFIVYKKKKAECTSYTDDVPETETLDPPPAEPPTDPSD